MWRFEGGVSLHQNLDRWPTSTGGQHEGLEAALVTVDEKLGVVFLKTQLQRLAQLNPVVNERLHRTQNLGLRLGCFTGQNTAAD